MINSLHVQIENDTSECRLGTASWVTVLNVSLFLLMALCQSSVAQSSGSVSTSADWTSFRNGGNSRVLPKKVLPSTWAANKGIAWQAELPGYGQSSPLIVENSVLVTAVEGPNKETNLIVCLDRDTGDERWRISQPSTQTGPSNFMHSRAAPTPVTDNELSIAMFESGDLIAVRLKDGEKLWNRDLKKELGPFKSNHGLGSSLAQTSDSVFVNLEHDGPSALLAIRKSDGTTKWTAKRPSGSSWSSPVVMSNAGRSQVIVSSGGEVAGYDSETGKELWKFDDLAGNTVPSPLVVGNKIFIGARMPEFGSVATAAKSNFCLEFANGASEPTVRWRSQRCIADYASPVVCEQNVLLINGNGIVGCLDKETGEEKFRKRIGVVCWATPIVCGDQIYFFGKNGKTTVVKADADLSIVSNNYLWDEANPPRPTSYVEYFPSSKKAGGHGSHSHSTEDPADGHNENHGETHGSNLGGNHGAGHSSNHGSDHDKSRSPGSGMLAGMLKRDVDGDGLLTGPEIPKRLASVMENIDLDKDGSLDNTELKKMADSFAEKRKGSRQSSRDPIVYGVAADSRGIIVRTGTRLYSIGRKSNQ
jgi:outer membrane protein assembly factor BamB